MINDAKLTVATAFGRFPKTPNGRRYIGAQGRP